MNSFGKYFLGVFFFTYLFWIRYLFDERCDMLPGLTAVLNSVLLLEVYKLIGVIEVAIKWHSNVSELLKLYLAGRVGGWPTHRLSINGLTKRGKEKSPSDGHCQYKKEMDDH
jgi:hypothetical protein